MQHTAEFISPLHPDKICDRIADTILDEYLKQDKYSRVAIEVLAGHGQINIIGEVTSKANIDIKKNIKGVFGVKDEIININLVKQSPEIARGVDIGGAGDQGIMVGYACDENKEMVPQEYYLARNLCKNIYSHYPVDGKTQITIEDNKIICVVVSWQGVDKKTLLKLVKDWLKDKKYKKDICFYINEAGDWDIGGLQADTGLTGRKIVTDNYGPRIPIGGGAFSGKDPSKVDRSGAYLARNIAINYLKKYNAQEVIIKIAYAIGKKEPVMITSLIDGNKEIFTKNVFELKDIIQKLNLYSPIYSKTAKWGSFGNGFNWDK